MDVNIEKNSIICRVCPVCCYHAMYAEREVVDFACSTCGHQMKTIPVKEYTQKCLKYAQKHFEWMKGSAEEAVALASSQEAIEIIEAIIHGYGTPKINLLKFIAGCRR